jgi:glutathione S-transferase
MYGAYVHTPTEVSKSAYKARLQSFGMDPFPVANQSPQQTREVLTTGLNKLAAAIDAQGGSNGHVIGDTLTFADIAAAAYVEWFLVNTKESDHILAANGGRWKKLLEDLK